jgi:hypothetical protein
VILTGHGWERVPETCEVCAEEGSEEGGSEKSEDARDGEDDNEGLS